MANDNQAFSCVNGWFKAIRNSEALELIHANPNAFILAYIIAYRAQWDDAFNRHNLLPGEALLGDHEQYGLTRQKYRTAKQHLSRFKFATFKTTNRGTVAKLLDTRLFSVSILADNQLDNTQATIRQPSANHQTTTTNKEKKEKNSKKGERPLAEFAGWQLEKDAERLRGQIKELANSSAPDKDLLQANRSRLAEIKEEMKRRGISERKAHNDRNAGTSNEGRAHEYANFKPRETPAPTPTPAPAPAAPQASHYQQEISEPVRVQWEALKEELG